jgi:hypothetical protein
MNSQAVDANMMDDSSSFYQDSPEAEHQADRTLLETENIFLIFRGGDPVTDAPTGAPTPRPLSRDFNYRECGGDFDNSALVGVADVHFVYDVEITETLNGEEERTMLDALETAMIDSLFDSACGRRLGSSRRRLEIHSISSGNRDKIQGDCAVTSAEATVCNRYDGSAKVGYTDIGDNDGEFEAGNTALQVVSLDMIEDTYVDAMNLALGSLYDSSNAAGIVDGNSSMVTRISYVGTSFYDGDLQFNGLQYQNWAVEDGNMTTLGKVFVPVMALLFVGMLTAMYLSVQKYKQRRRFRQLAVYRAKGDSEYRRDLDPFEEDLKDLAMRSNTQDVHRCNKTNCAACTRQMPHQIEEMLATMEGEEDSAHQEKVEIVDPDSQSLVSGLTGVLGEWSLFGRTTKPEIRVLQNETRDQSIEDLFEDEPRSVTFLRVDEGLYADDERSRFMGMGVKRKIIDHTGNVRSAVEL